MWCWTCGAGLLSRLQRRGNVVPAAWIVYNCSLDDGLT